jgi:hypothetical protein
MKMKIENDKSLIPVTILVLFSFLFNFEPMLSTVLRRAFATKVAKEIPTTGLCFELTPEQKDIQALARQVKTFFFFFFFSKNSHCIFSLLVMKSCRKQLHLTNRANIHVKIQYFL